MQRGRSGINKRKSNILVLFIGGLLLLILVVYSIHSNWKAKSSGSSEISLLSLSVDSTNYLVRSNESRLIFAIAQYSNGDKVSVNENSHFTSSNSNLVTVDSSGIVKGIKSGTAEIEVSYGRFKKKIHVTVSNDFLQMNVKDFGAAGDGIRDDTSAFQDAIDKLGKQGGGDLFIPAGIYILHPIFLEKNVNLVGEDRDSVILKLSDLASDGQTRLINMNHNTKVQSITCDGNYQNHPKGSEHMHCIFVYDKNNIIIENNKLMNAVGDGISITGSSKTSNYVVISNNIVQENQRSQIVIEQVNHLRVVNNTISSKTGHPGVHFEPWEERQFYDAKVYRNTISTNSTGYCSQLAGSDSASAAKGISGYFYNGIEFYKNTINAPSGKLLIEDTAGAKIYDNVLNVSTIYIWRKNKDVKIFNNEIHATKGIHILGGENGKLISEGTSIFENTIFSSNHGVLIEDGAGDTNITQNVFTGSGKGAGVKLVASQNIMNTSIEKNKFQRYQDGVDFSSISEKGANNLGISRNTFSNINGYAFLLTGKVQKVSMDNNLVTETSGVKIMGDPSMEMSDISITNNRISGGKRGIYQYDDGVGSLKRLTISGNTIENTTDTGDGNTTTGAAIEIQRYSTVVKDVSILNNILSDNAVNKITVPDRLDKSVENNLIE